MKLSRLAGSAVLSVAATFGVQAQAQVSDPSSDEGQPVPVTTSATTRDTQLACLQLKADWEKVRKSSSTSATDEVACRPVVNKNHQVVGHEATYGFNVNKPGLRWVLLPLGRACGAAARNFSNAFGEGTGVCEPVMSAKNPDLQTGMKAVFRAD